jgi:PKD repeat protein
MTKYFTVTVCLTALLFGCGGGGGNSGQPPVVTLAADFNFVKLGNPTNFTAAASDPDGTITEYVWNFGDTAAATTAVGTIFHTYTAVGDYTATVTVKDNSGKKASASLIVTITAAGGGPNVKLDGVGLDVVIADGPVNSITVNGAQVAIDASQTVTAPVTLTTNTTPVAINATDVAGNPAPTWNATITKTE